MKLKKYKNRKLYNPNSRSYTTLETIYQTILSPQEDLVVTGPNSEDFTIPVLLEVIKFNKNLTKEQLLEIIRSNRNTP